ncbi:MAG: hypothetical protein RBU37_20345 [Myxococcota bacterium]|jgi:hypothetical protein|nr:hypothetical protein [Myxococcota bacterium]
MSASAYRLQIPLGLEKVLFLASRDPHFAERLLKERCQAIDLAALPLTTLEQRLLASVPEPQLRSMIRSVQQQPSHARSMMRSVATVSLAALSSLALGACQPQEEATKPSPQVAQGEAVQLEQEPATVSAEVSAPSEPRSLAAPPMDAQSEQTPPQPKEALLGTLLETNPDGQEPLFNDGLDFSADVGLGLTGGGGEGSVKVEVGQMSGAGGARVSISDGELHIQGKLSEVGGLDDRSQQLVRRILLQKKARFLSCWVKAMGEVEGSFELALRIARLGTVTFAELSEGPEESALRMCVSQEAEQLRFPEMDQAETRISFRWTVKE